MTFSIQKKYSKKANFKDWYEEKRDEMKANETFTFFRDKRNIILKQRAIDGDDIEKKIKLVGYSPHIPCVKPVLKYTKEDGKYDIRVCDPSSGEELKGSFSATHHRYTFKEHPERQVKEMAYEYFHYLEALVKEAKDKFE